MTEPTELQPIPGSWWTHRNGAPYTVLMIANSDTEDEARYPVTVVYQGDNGKVWSRPASDWHRSMTATTPQPVQAQAVAITPLPIECNTEELKRAVPLTHEQSHALLERMATEADQWAEGLSYEPTREQLSGWCVAFLMRELPAHDIKGGQHGANT